MDNFHINVEDLVAAFEQPLDHLDLWGSLGPNEATERLREAVDAIGAADDEINQQTARLVLGWLPEDPKIVDIARRFRIKPSAVSQRKSRIDRILTELGEDDEISGHPLVQLWKERAAHCVRVKDLPEWMRSCLTRGSFNAKWPAPQDLFWVLLHATMSRPRLLSDNSGTEWLVDMSLDERRDPKDRLSSVFESLADSLSKSGSDVYQAESLRDRLEELGISQLSLGATVDSMMHTVRRAISKYDQVLILSDADAKNLRRVIERVMKDLGVQRSEVALLIAEQHGRQPKSVANELGRI